MSQQAKVIVACVVLLVAAVAIGWHFRADSVMPGKTDQFAVWCPKCGATASVTKEEMVRKGFPDPEGGGWKMPCAACKAEAFVRRPDQPMPKELAATRP